MRVSVACVVFAFIGFFLSQVVLAENDYSVRSICENKEALKYFHAEYERLYAVARKMAVLNPNYGGAGDGRECILMIAPNQDRALALRLELNSHGSSFAMRRAFWELSSCLSCSEKAHMNCAAADRFLNEQHSQCSAER